jgi:septal ring factor EnvC (AmiA/AmiB activator)
MILAQSELKNKLLSGDKIQRELKRFESQRRGANTQLIDAQPKLHKLNKEIEDLTRVPDEDQALLDALVRYDFTSPAFSCSC